MAKIYSLTDIEAIRHYLNRIGARERSLRKAVVQEHIDGYDKDVCTITFGKDGSIGCKNPDYAPTDIEVGAIKAGLMRVEWPEIKPIKKIINPPELITQASNKDLFLFKDRDEQIIFVQVRMERGEKKAYIPFTYWDDDIWRMVEPDGELPLYNLDKLKDAAVVFIHEGAKAARRMQAIVDNVGIKTRSKDNRHPWRDEMATGAHVGWAGGAHAVHRTDWSPINGNGVQRAYIVADNDVAGRKRCPGDKQEAPGYDVLYTVYQTSFLLDSTWGMTSRPSSSVPGKCKTSIQGQHSGIAFTRQHGQQTLSPTRARKVADPSTCYGNLSVECGRS